MEVPIAACHGAALRRKESSKHQANATNKVAPCAINTPANSPNRLKTQRLHTLRCTQQTHMRFLMRKHANRDHTRPLIDFAFKGQRG
jgi:hypothetical protein